MKSKYTTCAKCGLRHSTLVRHRCAKPKGQDKKPETDPKEYEDLERGGKTESHDRHEGANDGDAGDGENANEKGDNTPADGDAEGDTGEGGSEAESGEGEGDENGEGTGKEGGGDGTEGEGESEEEAEGEGQGEGEAPPPQPPEPDAPPVVVVCTVLKYAALTAQCAKNGVIEITVTEEGLFVYGHDGGERSAFEVITWKEFEERSTLDGEFMVKDVIDAIDAQLATPKEELAKGEAEEEPKPKPKRKRKLTLPMFVGQRVVCRDGEVREVNRVDSGATAWFTDGLAVFADNSPTFLPFKVGGRGNGDKKNDRSWDALHDADDSPADGPKLTLPLRSGQRVVTREGEKGTVAAGYAAKEIPRDDNGLRDSAVTVDFDDGMSWEYFETDGKWCGQESDPDYRRHIVANAE